MNAGTDPKADTLKHGGDRKSDQSANSHDDTSLQKAADLMQVGRHTVADAKAVLRDAPDLFEKEREATA